jgi:nucleoid-associated protein YgaU
MAMQRDVKIGIAIGVLLIALIAVFWWFRHTRTAPVSETVPPAPEAELPGPVVPVAPPVGPPREFGAAVGATVAAPMMTSAEAASTTAAPAATATTTVPPAVAAEQTYKVQSGDTLTSISVHFYRTPVHWRVIYDANKDKIGAEPRNLKPGLELVIPPLPAALLRGPRGGPRGPVGLPKARPAATGEKYVVAEGDTLTSIAQKQYGQATKADIDRIYQANKETIGPDPNALKAGMELVIPPAH